MKLSAAISICMTLCLINSIASIKMCNPDKDFATEQCMEWGHFNYGYPKKNNWRCIKKWYLSWFEGGRCENTKDLQAENLVAYQNVDGYSATSLLLAFGFGTGLGVIGFLLTKRKGDVQSLESRYLVEM